MGIVSDIIQFANVAGGNADTVGPALPAAAWASMEKNPPVWPFDLVAVKLKSTSTRSGQRQRPEFSITKA
ncbi:hypothetical protein PR003_g15463 [Phytophthora rubi]|uniref:Uncharacterized protein n=1 Tax=Phytophthora rubi TaxID=129364 RepID=A0A6A4EZR5_9STRA|nr:hypothetical protein PR003_g15463 [Phytophthora rubi]